MAFRASVLTLYPDMFPGPLGTSLAGRALEQGIWALEATNIRDFATDKHRSVDDTPAGGGAGMVLRPDVLAAALDSVADGRPMLAMTPRGAPLTQRRVRELAAGEDAGGLQPLEPRLLRRQLLLRRFRRVIRVLAIGVAACRLYLNGFDLRHTLHEAVHHDVQVDA